MTNYSVFQQVLPGGTTTGGDAAHPIDLGIQFNITVTGYALDGYWFYVPSGGVTTGSSYSFQLFSTTNGTTGTLISGSTVTGSGTWTAAAWNFTTLSPSVSLAVGTTYIAVVTAPAGTVVYQALLHYWDGTGGGANNIVNGPITAWAAANALNTTQQTFNDPSTGGMTVTDFQNSFYGIDIDVSIPPPPSSGPLYTASMSSM